MLLVAIGYKLGPSKVAKLGVYPVSNKDTRDIRAGIVSPYSLVACNLLY